MKEYLKKLLAAKQAKQKHMETLLTKGLNTGETPNAEDEAAIKAIEDEIAVIDLNIARTEKLVTAAEAAEKSATVVEGTSPEGAIATAGGTTAPAGEGGRIQVVQNIEKGLGFAVAVKAFAVASKSGGAVSAIDVLKSWNAPESVQNFLIQKAKIGTTTDATFGKPLVDQQNLVGEFIELLRPQTIVGRMSGFRQVPFNITIPAQSSATGVNWVGETAKKPVTDMGFEQVKLDWAKLAGIVLLSDELIRFSNPTADALVRNDLIESVARFIDLQFLDPAKTETTISPASVLNGVTAITATGVTAAAYNTDLETLINTFIAGNLSLAGAYIIMSETRATQISMLRDALGNKYFPEMSAPLGKKVLLGLPVIESENALKKLVLVKPSEILMADDGGVDFAMSNEASITYNNGTDDITVNLFQENLTAIRAERFVRWKKRRPLAAAYIQYA